MVFGGIFVLRFVALTIYLLLFPRRRLTVRRPDEDTPSPRIGMNIYIDTYAYDRR